MNYLFKNANKEWEPLRIFTFRKYKEGVYYRDAVLESNPNLNMQLADITLDQGILRVDLNTSTDSSELRLGHYALPQLSTPIKEKTMMVKGCKVSIIDNGSYQLALIPLENWSSMETLSTKDLHPISSISKIMNISDSYTPTKAGPKLCATLMLWKKSGSTWKKSELMPIRSIEYSPLGKKVKVKFTSGEQKELVFD